MPGKEAEADAARCGGSSAPSFRSDRVFASGEDDAPERGIHLTVYRLTPTVPDAFLLAAFIAKWKDTRGVAHSSIQLWVPPIRGRLAPVVAYKGSSSFRLKPSQAIVCPQKSL